MNLTGYTMDLESLINRYTVLILFFITPVILLLFLIWFLPYLPYLEKKTKKKHNKRKTKKKLRSEKEAKRKILIGQITVSVLLIVFGIFVVKNDVTMLSNLKKDLNQNTVLFYEGDANLSSPDIGIHNRAYFNFIVDSRIVNFENSDETYLIDMSKTWEGQSLYSGDFYGKITYGKNSKFILKIE